MRAQVWCDWGRDDDKLFYVEGDTEEELKSKAAEKVKKITNGYKINEWIREEDEDSFYWFFGNQDMVVSLEVVSDNYGSEPAE